MTARATFGRKGVTGSASEGSGVAVSRRAAFLGDERARAERFAESEAFPAPARVEAAKEEEPVAAPRPVGPRSLKLAYALWLVLGTAGAHRLYLGRTLSGALQALVCAGSFAAMAMQYYEAFAGIAICWLAMFLDGFQLKKMHAEATAQAETFA